MLQRNFAPRARYEDSAPPIGRQACDLPLYFLRCWTHRWSGRPRKPSPLGRAAASGLHGPHAVSRLGAAGPRGSADAPPPIVRWRERRVPRYGAAGAAPRVSFERHFGCTVTCHAKCPLPSRNSYLTTWLRQQWWLKCYLRVTADTLGGRSPFPRLRSAIHVAAPISQSALTRSRPRDS
jgi:hypothetical protein